MKSFMPGRDQRDFAEALGSVMVRRDEVGASDSSPALWRDLAELGLQGLCTPAIGGSPLDLVVGMETLGFHLCPGPTVATIAACELLSGDRLAALVGGELRATITDGHYIPWSNPADLVIEIKEDGAWLVPNVQDEAQEKTLSGESWRVGHCHRGEPLGDAGRATSIFNLALSAYLLGAARRLLEQGAEHARSRTQFNKPIGSFQAVAHPLANSWAATSAARALAFLVAAEVTNGQSPLARSWQLRAAATRASVDSALVVHQAMGAMGFSTETGVAAASTRIRQWSFLPPDRPELGGV